MKSYVRPLALVFGGDARLMIGRGDALALGGLPDIGFTQVEVRNRAGECTVMSIGQYTDQSVLQRLSSPRPAFGGVAMDKAQVMGIVNVTPDSFSDGGRFDTAQAAIDHGRAMALEGAALLDVGGESTRPGSDTVAVEDEIARVVPVIEGLAADHVVSCDTRKADVMTAALQAGARILNDVSALRHDPASARVVAAAGAPVVLMHAQGEPKTMQLNPRYDDVLLDVYDGLADAVATAEAAGIARSRICVDPGIGFGKSFAQNLDLLAGLTLFHGLGVPVLVGLSRKGFVGALTGEKKADDRVHGSVGGALQAAMAGAHVLRVHDVKATVQALSVFRACHDPRSADI